MTTAAVRVAVGAYAALVVSLELLGTAGWLRPAPALALLAALAAGAGAVALSRARPPRPARAPSPPWRSVDAALAAALVAAFATRLWSGLHRTTFLYDTLSYHLHAPASWMHAGRLEIVPAVFGDPTPAYAPAGVELWLWLLMAPLRSDYLAAAGQLPLAGLAVLAIAATVREAGASDANCASGAGELRSPEPIAGGTGPSQGPVLGRAPALAAGLAFLLCPEVWQQAPTAMVDVAMAAFFLSALPFLVRLARGVEARDVAAVGLAAGLCAGTKYVGLVLALVPVAIAGALILRARERRARSLGLLLGAALVAGGFFYLRNLIVTGNPLYPAAVHLGPLRLPGLYDRAAMRASEYHLPIGDVGALGGMLLDAGIGFCAGAALALARVRRPAWGLLALALVALFWLVVPYQESRFLFPAYGVAAVAIGQAAAANGRRALAWAPLALALGGALVEGPTDQRLAVAGAALLGPLALAVGARLDARARTALAASAAALVVAAVGVGLRGYRARDPGYTVGDDLAPAWAWLRAHVRGARVAYTGDNLAFPLAGADLANEVRYVNVAGGPEDRLHDFPAGAGGGAEPAPYRDGARFERWQANLRAARAQVLFVAALYPNVRRTIQADGDGFPVERAWADAHADLFSLRYASPAARVYALTWPP